MSDISPVLELSRITGEIPNGCLERAREARQPREARARPAFLPITDRRRIDVDASSKVALGPSQGLPPFPNSSRCLGHPIHTAAPMILVSTLDARLAGKRHGCATMDAHDVLVAPGFLSA